MMMDKELLFSEDQELTSTADSTNVIDMGAAGLGGGEAMELIVWVPTALTSGGESTLTISMVTDSDPLFGSAKTKMVSPAIAKSDLSADAEVFKVRIPADLERYIKLTYIVGTADFEAGTISAGLTMSRQTNL